MALVTRFETPAMLRDLPATSPFYQQWHDYLRARLPDAAAGNTGGTYYDASVTNVNVVAEHAIVWMGFPRTLMVYSNRDDRRAAFMAGEGRYVQEEYFEWHVTRNSAGKITKVVFVTETPEYWELLANVDPARLVDLYRTLVSPAVREADLYTTTNPTTFPGDGRWSPVFGPTGGRWYHRQNRWNKDDGIVHYIQRINTLGAALGLASGSINSPTASDGTLAEDTYEAPQSPQTNVDPRVAMDIASLGRKGLAVTLRDPIGLYIAGWDDTGWTKPDGTPVGNYWRVVRGVQGAALRVEYQVPAGEGFVVGDIRIGGRPIDFGGQMAEHMTVSIAGVAGARAGR